MTADDPTTGNEQLDAVERSVTLTAGEPPISTVVRLSRSYPTDLDDLWTACTDPERLARWFAPVSGDLRAGGRYQVEDNAGGTIETCEPPTGFALTWEFGGASSRVEVRLEAESGSSARLTLVHTADVDPDWWDRYGPGSVGIGWDLGLLGLAEHLTTGGSVPLESTSWVRSEDARLFVAGSSRRWADRSVAAGTPLEVARAAESRSTAFHLGDDPEGA